MVKETIDPQLLTPELKVDIEIDLNQINDQAYAHLKTVCPFWTRKYDSSIYDRKLKDTGYGKCVGEDDKHLRLTATQTRVMNDLCVLVLA